MMIEKINSAIYNDVIVLLMLKIKLKSNGKHTIKELLRVIKAFNQQKHEKKEKIKSFFIWLPVTFLQTTLCCLSL